MKKINKSSDLDSFAILPDALFGVNRYLRQRNRSFFGWNKEQLKESVLILLHLFVFSFIHVFSVRLICVFDKALNFSHKFIL